MCVKDCVQWRATKRCKRFHRPTGDRIIGRSTWPTSTHTCIATKIKRCKVSFRVGSKLCGYCSKVPRRHRRLTAPPDPAQCQKCHAWQGKRKWMSASATPATQSAAAWQAPNGPSSPPEPAQCHACHVKCACRQVPHLPRKVPRRHGRLTATKHATRPNPLPEVPCLRRKNEDGCPQVPRHVKRRWISPSATHACHAKCRGVTGD